MANKLPWKNYNGIAVSVEDSGDFCAEVNGVFIRQPCWEYLRVRIEQEKKADAKALKLELDCIVLIGDEETGEYSVKQLNLVGLNRSNATYKWGEVVNHKFIIYVLPNTVKNVTLLEQLAVAKSTVRDIEGAIKERTLRENRWGSRIEPSNYNAELLLLQKRYNIALEVDKDRVATP